MDAKILLERLQPTTGVKFSNLSFQNEKKSKNVHANLKKYSQVAKKSSKTPFKALPKPFQNNVKNVIEKNTVFSYVFFIIWDAHYMKNAAPVEAKRYILQNRLFRKKYPKYC